MLLVLPLLGYGQVEKPKNVSWYDDKILHFGFSVGFNTMDFNITPSQANMKKDSLYPSVAILNPGINIQIITDFRPARFFDIRFLPGVSFGQRTIRFYKDQVLVNAQQRLESSFLEFPLLLKFKGTRLNNVRPYVVGGINFRYDLAGKKQYDEDKPIYVRLQRADLYYEFGPGLDFYLPYFKLSVELKVSTGTRDILVHDPANLHPEYSNAIQKMRSQIWIVAFHFE
jgi:Outer membrane protein beta-barrel domain